MNMKGYRFLEVANVNTFFYQISNVLLGGSFLITFSNYCKFVITDKNDIAVIVPIGVERIYSRAKTVYCQWG